LASRSAKSKKVCKPTNRRAARAPPHTLVRMAQDRRSSGSAPPCCGRSRSGNTGSTLAAAGRCRIGGSTYVAPGRLPRFVSDAEPHGVSAGLGARAGAELVEDRGDVVDGTLGQHGRLRDLCVALATCDEPQDRELPGRRPGWRGSRARTSRQPALAAPVQAARDPAAAGPAPSSCSESNARRSDSRSSASPRGERGLVGTADPRPELRRAMWITG
jgi:hypothetical protein